jgi:Uma2 family endonuclease
MAMPIIARSDWTVEMLDALPDDGQRYEIIDGELFVTPAPGDVHQLVLGELYVRFHAYLRGTSVGKAMFSPADVRRGDRTRNRVQPDLFVVRLTDGTRPAYPFDLSDLLLTIEAVSPSNPRYDYQTKRQLYLQNGVPEYWVVNSDARNISRWVGRDDPGEVLSRTISWHAAAMAEPLVIDIPELFEEAIS